jgi:hypothetical protein
VFEKISGMAERLATDVSESRRGFLARMGQLALGAAGVFAGLLVLPREAQAISSITRACHLGGNNALTGICIDKSNGNCRWCYNFAQYPVGTHVGWSLLSLCGYRVAASSACICR